MGGVSGERRGWGEERVERGEGGEMRGWREERIILRTIYLATETLE